MANFMNDWLLPPPLLADADWIRIGLFLLIIVVPWLIKQAVAWSQKQHSSVAPPHAPQVENATGNPNSVPDWVRQTHADDVIHDVEIIEPEPQRSNVLRPAVHATIDPPRTFQAPVASTLSAAVPAAAGEASAGDSTLTQRATQLGGELSQATTQRIEQHAHAAFDHAVGALGDSSDAIHEANQGKAKKLPVTARDIKAAFADPMKVRQAIILNEILTPPSSRW